MSNLEKVIDQMVKCHGGNIRNLAAWVIGYTNSLYIQINDVRKAVGEKECESLYERLLKEYNKRGDEDE